MLSLVGFAPAAVVAELPSGGWKKRTRGGLSKDRARVIVVDGANGQTQAGSGALPTPRLGVCGCGAYQSSAGRATDGDGWRTEKGSGGGTKHGGRSEWGDEMARRPSEEGEESPRSERHGNRTEKVGWKCGRMQSKQSRQTNQRPWRRVPQAGRGPIGTQRWSRRPGPINRPRDTLLVLPSSSPALEPSFSSSSSSSS